VVCDIWHLGGGWYWSKPARVQSWQAIMLSPLPNGASVPMIGTANLTAEYHGEEPVTVPAGTFPCRHFSFPLTHRPGHLPEHLWYSGGRDLTLVKIRWDYSKTTYELVEIHDWAEGK